MSEVGDVETVVWRKSVEEEGRREGRMGVGRRSSKRIRNRSGGSGLLGKYQLPTGSVRTDRTSLLTTRTTGRDED